VTRIATSRPGAALVAVVLAALAVGVGTAAVGIPSAAASPPRVDGGVAHGPTRHPAASAGAYGPGGGSAGQARGEEEAGVVASSTFRATVGDAASAFTRDVDALQQAVDSGNTTAARTDELEAQAQYDALRYLSDAGTATSSPLDERPGDVPSGQHLAGLHLVERDLWVGGNAAPAVGPLVAAAPQLEVALERLQLSPRAIDLVAVQELGWVTSVAVPGLEEVYSHRDSIDAEATVAAAEAAFQAVAPLGRLVTDGRTTTAELRLGALGGAVQALGPPGTAPDSAIPQGRWRSVAEDADATAAVLSELAPALAGYGPRQIYGYNS
jgi:hypothetical protein